MLVEARRTADDLDLMAGSAAARLAAVGYRAGGGVTMFTILSVDWADRIVRHQRLEGGLVVVAQLLASRVPILGRG